MCTATMMEYCHTRLHLGFSAKLGIWQVPTCKMEPRSGYIFCQNRPATRPPGRPPPDHMDVRLARKLEFVGCLVLLMLCGVPTPIVHPIHKLCAVSPPSLLAPCSENMCGVPPSRYTLFLCGVPPLTI